MTGQRLPRAFRSRPRPSSALGAKASTVCPCSLDQKNTGIDVAMEFSRCGAPAHGRSLKTQQRAVEVDIVLGELAIRTAEAIDGASAYRRETPASLERR
jgi:hypothetical protein